MLRNHFCPILSFGGVGSKAHVFDVTHFWIGVLGADDVVARLASRFEFKLHKIGRMQTIRLSLCSQVPGNQ